MTMPSGIAVVDTMVGIPPEPGDMTWLGHLRPLLRDEESLSSFRFPAEYMFKNLPAARFADDTVAAVLTEMDRFGVERAMITASFGNERALGALRNHPDRFFASFEVDPNAGMDGVRALRRAVEELGVKAASAFPAGTFPQVPADDARWYPLYAACIDLGIPMCMCLGVPGPRVPAAPQDVMRIDEICYRFPELTLVTRHGCEPWTALAVKLLLKWPNLYYSTSAFAPKHYPRDIVEFANTRGADKVIYAGYFPMGLSLETIFTQLEDVPFRHHVWPRFLRENALRVFALT
ncbi:MAG TPA: amidohydrolase family protein [Acidimicrobiia bacterium]|nr:amidohydrolase family protein [Acidimicrobiia bacterium]